MPAITSITALRHPSRWAAALCVLAGGLTHVPLIKDHLEEAPYIGVLFILLVVAAVLLAAALLVRDAPIVWMLVALVMGAAVVAFFVSRTIGLPQMSDDVGDWWGESMGLPAVTSEVLAFALAISVLVSRRHSAPASGASTARGVVKA